ncbi:phthiocerol/phenolphthiocerol synthesis polyketide synthase type I PpsE [Ruminiclostridium hungatei]|uniref:Phthiocerol/phenolphthiocerol synthesis polyketide synthase type I PpsE n=1 Tax=Ruminiclostridium hungatei TaxID=48256 RepID=A0A1V4SEJ7_RUMHU|nr:type I polyketide synthase [Ruminiclostridium hungatei]OPX42332.1 phthiocerol/phenolphthiocerol synthesis polyketide synthase type I PpsE [Ruminiclostridium hungatei]
MEQKYKNYNENDIAIIGMSCRFPGADSVADFWENLKNGVESITVYTDEELEASGVNRSLRENPKYVRASGSLEQIENFDAYFFDYSPKEASMIDPQHRLFLEQAWIALEDAGCNPERYPGLIGVYAGTGMNTYLYRNLQSHANLLQEGSGYYTMVASDKDFLATRVSYKLNLTGPSMTVQTACSTSLVAVHQACQSIRAGECDMALAGGVSLRIPQKAGYLYQEGIVLSPDGHCRAFDAKAGGTVIGNGAGVVVLKMLSDALEDGDRIYAVIKGSALNNDGSLKAGYTAPGLDRQAAVITEALAVSGVEPDTVSYVEAHGTGTPIGDPIEIKALNKAYGNTGTQKCAVGSVKTNIGHLDAAAGVAGLIKTALCLHHGQIPASLNFDQPNPKIDFANSRFYVNTSFKKWESAGLPRRAGLSSFGIGGTNAHAILEEAPVSIIPGPAREVQLLALSARTEAALEEMRQRLAQHLSGRTGQELADIAFTQNIGRKTFKHRFILTCRSREEAAGCLLESSQNSWTAVEEAVDRPVAFLFPGQGSQYVNMGLELYRTEQVFKDVVDECCDILLPELKLDLRHILFPEAAENGAVKLKEAAELLGQTQYTQPALFVIEYALAKLWLHWGIQPHAMIGHSIGEYAAACLAGVFSLSDALYLVARRGRLMNSLPAGSMLMVALPEEQVNGMLNDKISIAAINGASLCVVSGENEAIGLLEESLSKTGVTTRRLHTSHAFHSAMMEPILPEFREALQRVTLNPPQIPCISNLSGELLKPEEAVNPEYWVRHLRQPVRFADGLVQMLSQPDRILLEVGPGRTLSTLAKRHPKKDPAQEACNSLPNGDETQPADAYTIAVLGKLWLKGVKINWNRYYQYEERKRVSLPAYPFERQRYWFDYTASGAAEKNVLENKRADVRSDRSDWFYQPSWKRADLPVQVRQTRKTEEPRAKEPQNEQWLVFCDNEGFGDLFLEKTSGVGVITVRQAQNYEKTGSSSFAVNPVKQEHYLQLFTELKEQAANITKIIHMWSVDQGIAGGEIRNNVSQTALDLGFYSILYLVQSIGMKNLSQPMELDIVTSLLQEVTGESIDEPLKSAVLGALAVIPYEYRNITCRSIDLEGLSAKDAGLLSAELSADAGNETVEMVACRRQHRWIRTLDPVRLAPGNEDPILLKHGGVYLITGGTGGIGLVLAEYLARRFQARLLLTTRSEFPGADEWSKWLAAHPSGNKFSRIITKIRQIEALGGEVLVLRADVSDRGAMAVALSLGIEKYGVINGVFHAAGIEGSGMIQLKTREMAEEVFAPKLKGALVLQELFSTVPPDFMVLFSSINSIIGRIGQMDYSAANMALSYLTHREAADYPVLAIAWDTWKEAGMAANPVYHPLLDNCLLKSESQAVYLTQYKVDTHWVLNEHGIMGKATVPGTTYMEMALAALSDYQGCSRGEITDVHFYTPLVLADYQRRDTYTIIKKKDRGYQFYIVSRLQGQKPQWLSHADGIIRPGMAEVNQGNMKPQQFVTDTWKKIIEPLKQGFLGDMAIQNRAISRGSVTVPSMVIGAAQGDRDLFMEFGPRWQCLKEVQFTGKEGLALFELDTGLMEEAGSYVLHPALLDFATSFLRLFTNQGSYLPYGYKRLEVYRALPPALYSHARMLDKAGSSPREDEKTLQFDIAIYDKEGNICVRIEEFSVMRVQDSHKITELTEITASIPFNNPDPAVINDSLLLRRELFEENMDYGLTNAEGMEALMRILWGGLKEVIVSKQPLEARMARNLERYRNIFKQTDRAEVQAAKHARPKLSTPYAPARDETEKAIVGIWEEALGIDRVGIYDNFFELGGDSLLISQIHSRFKEHFEDDVSLANLLQYPNISDLVQFMKKEEPEQDRLSSVKELTGQQRGALKKRQEMMKNRLEAKK